MKLITMANLTNLKFPRFLFPILLILILVAGGGYYYLYLREPKPKPPEEVTEVEPEEVTEVGIEYPQGTVERIEEGKIVIRANTGLLELLVDESTIVTFETKSLAEALSDEKVASLEDIKTGDEIAASVKTFSDGTERAFFITIFSEQ